MAEYTPSELSVKIADEWLESHRKSDTWRIVDMLRDEVVRLAAAEHRATRAEARIKAVRELHVKEPGVGTAYCIDCEQPLPCDTIRALDATTTQETA